MSFLGPVISTGLRTAARYVYQGLRQQERIIDYTYRKTGLYNRGVVRGIKHGLSGGQIIGGGLSLGLNAEDSPGNNASTLQQKNKFTSRKPYKTRRRPTKCYSSRYSGKQRSYNR